MALKDKIMNLVFIKHPKFFTLGMGLAVTFGTGIAVGMIEQNQAFAELPKGPGSKPT